MGMRREDFVQSWILEPLEMRSSSPGLTQSPGYSDYALPYAEIDGEVRRVPFFSKTDVGPAGSISSTASDMAEWLLLHLNSGSHEGQVFVSEENLVQMHSLQMVIGNPGRKSASEQLDRFDEISPGSYDLCWRINTYRGQILVHHLGLGEIDGFSSLASIMPKEGSGVVVLSSMNESPSHYILSFGIYDRLLDLEPLPWNQRIKSLQAVADQASQNSLTSREANRKSGTKPSHSLEDYAGDYEHPAYGKINISVEDGNLVTDYDGNIFPLTHYHYDIFYMTADLEDEFMPVSFGGDVEGNISLISVPLEPAMSDIPYTRQEKRKPIGGRI